MEKQRSADFDPPVHCLSRVKKGDILEAMQGYIACQVKPAFFRLYPPEFPAGSPVFSKRSGFVIFIFFPGDNPVKFTDPGGKFTVESEGAPMPVLYSPVAKYRLFPPGGSLTPLQKDVDTIVTGLSILAGFIPNGVGAGVAFFNSVEKGDYAGAIGSAVSAILGGIDLPVTDAFSSLMDLAQTMRDLTSNPETGAANYSETELVFISMVAVEQAFSTELIAKFKEKGISPDVNYNYTRG
jgi:hypothetical protein